MSDKANKKPRLWLRLLLVMLLVALIAGALGFIKYRQIQELILQSSVPKAPVKVEAAQVKTRKWPRRLKAIGSLKSLQGVELSSEVGGVVRKINFRSGQKVKAGEILLELNDELELAQIKTARARLSAAQSRHRRTKKLKGKKYVSEFELDEVISALNVARAELASAEASLAKRSITAPFAGILGIKNVDKGDYISPGVNIVSLQSIDKLYLDFTLPEQFYHEVKKGQTVWFKVKSDPDKTFSGKVSVWDPILHDTTRNLNVRAIVDNAASQLAPGMFAQIVLETDIQTEVMAVPETAIFYNIYGESVYVLAKDKDNAKSQETYILESRQVKVLYRKDGMAGITKGLHSKDMVVTSGQLKLYPGLDVAIANNVH